MARNLKVYRAEDAAARAAPAPALDGTREAAQAYLDKITRSAWWKRTCPPSWRGDRLRGAPGSVWVDDVPARIIVRAHGRAVTGHASYGVRRYRGHRYPHIGLGTARPHGNLPAIADPWVILHEVAHIMAVSADDKAGRGHGPIFAYYFRLCVTRWLGREAASALREAYTVERIKHRGRAA